jgi:hypothetical protein
MVQHDKADDDERQLRCRRLERQGLCVQIPTTFTDDSYEDTKIFRPWALLSLTPLTPAPLQPLAANCVAAGITDSAQSAQEAPPRVAAPERALLRACTPPSSQAFK